MDIGYTQVYGQPMLIQLQVNHKMSGTCWWQTVTDGSRWLYFENWVVSDVDNLQTTMCDSQIKGVPFLWPSHVSCCDTWSQMGLMTRAAHQTTGNDMVTGLQAMSKLWSSVDVYVMMNECWCTHDNDGIRTVELWWKGRWWWPTKIVRLISYTCCHGNHDLGVVTWKLVLGPKM